MLPPYMCMNHTKKQLAMRNGPNGISLCIVNPRFPVRNARVGVNLSSTRCQKVEEKNNSGTETSAPRTNANRSALMPHSIPRSQPIGSASFTSPSPIHLPRDTNQSAKSGSATRGPEKIVSAKIYGSLTPHVPAIAVPKESTAHAYTHASGMIVWYRSYTAIAMNNAAIGSATSWNPSESGEVPIKANATAVEAS